MHRVRLATIVAAVVLVTSIAGGQRQTQDPARFLTQPLVRDIYTADPSAHEFGGRLFVYPSHDIDAGVAPDDLGSHFAMRDYHVFSMESVGGTVTDHGVALDITDVPWASRQMWAPRRRREGGQVLPVFPREGQTGRLSDRRRRRGQTVGSLQSRAEADRPQL